MNSAWTKPDWPGKLRHLGYAGGWKKFEPLWDWVIRFKQVGHMLPLLETILAGSDGRLPATNQSMTLIADQSQSLTSS